MKQAFVIALTSLTLFAGTALASDRDDSLRTLSKAEDHVRKAIELLNRARNDNRLDKEGEGEDALHLLRRAKSKIGDSMDNVRRQR